MPTIAAERHHPHHLSHHGRGGESNVHPNDRCSGCDSTGLSLLACDDPDFRNQSAIPGQKPRFCANCMIGKKVRVFWPVDNSWYTGMVLQYNASNGEHLLKYDDEDTEWVKIGESNTCAPPGEGDPNEASHVDLPNSGSADNLDLPGRNETTPPRPGHSQSFPPNGRTTPDRPWPMEREHGHPDGHYGMFPPGSGGYGMHPGPGGFPPGMHPHHPHHPGPPHMSHGPFGGGGPPFGYPGVMNIPPTIVNSSGPDDNSRRNSTKKPPSEPSSSPTSMTGSVSKRKAGPKAWTKEEDAKLLSIVQSMRMPMKWSIVAQSLPDRTGKQCRERYVNHLNPRLKVTDWSPVEDATIFYFYNISGSHWAKMSRGIPGRTDNGIKNRFHNLRRQLEREDEHRLRLSTAENFPEEIRLDRIREFPAKMEGKAAELWDMQKGIGVLAAQSILGGSIPRNSSRFGPFRKAQVGDMCVRCGFLMPSLHTGSELCTKSGWCLSCTRIPPHICCNLLRECLNLRREQDTKVRDIIESWEEQIVPGQNIQ